MPPDPLEALISIGSGYATPKTSLKYLPWQCWNLCIQSTVSFIWSVITAKNNTSYYAIETCSFEIAFQHLGFGTCSFVIEFWYLAIGTCSFLMCFVFFATESCCFVIMLLHFVISFLHSGILVLEHYKLHFCHFVLRSCYWKLLFCPVFGHNNLFPAKM